MNGLPYLLDANVFITAKNFYYAFDLAPGFWDSLATNAANGNILSIDYVKRELEAHQDNLKDWIINNFVIAFNSTNDNAVIQSYTNVINWVQNQNQFTDAAKADFARGADGWLVAYAMAKGGIVVTLEILNLNIRRKVPIPNVCQQFGVQFVDTFEMLRQLGVQLIS